jgi:hypothetical protein
MRKSIIQLSLTLLLLLSAAFGDSISYTVTGLYDASVLTTPLTAPNNSFSFTFSEPIPVVPLPIDANSFDTFVSVTYSSGLNLPLTIPGAEVAFFDTTGGGLFGIFFELGGSTYDWEFFGPQAFGGTISNPILHTGTFLADSRSAFFFNDQPDPGSPIMNGQVVAVAAVPEPGTLALLGTGFLSILAAKRRKTASSVR